MARLDQEDTKAFNTLLQSGRFSHSRKVLTGDVAITHNGSLVNFLDPGGVDRNVTLPPNEEGRFYVVSNVGTAFNLILSVTTLLPGDTALLFSSDSEWTALRGWAALAVFTNTTNGLVPAPNSGVPGSLFLRDDGQWGQVQVTGIVDAFKFITDGTNTAVGSGPDTFKLRSSTGKVGITVTNGDLTHGDNANFTVNEASIDHDLLLNFFSDEHVGHTGVVLTAGTGLSGGGDITASRTFNLDLNDLTTDTPVLADSFAFYDASGSDTNKATLTVLNGILDHNSLLNYSANRHIDHTTVSMIAGTGLSGGGDISTSRTFNLNLTGLTSDTPAVADEIAFYDVSGSDHNKATIATLNGILDHNSLLNYSANRHVDHTAVTLTAGNGLTGGGDISASRSFAVGAGTGITVNADDVALNINGLTADATPDTAADYVATWDASASTHKKVLINALAGALNINGLTITTPAALDEIPVYDVSAAGNRKVTVNTLQAFKNYFLNSAMQVSQENGTTSSTASTYYPVDQYLFNTSNAGAWTIAQVASVTPGGSPNRIRFTCVTNDGTVGSTDYAVIIQRIEGIRTADLKLGTASAKTIICQFGVKAPAGTYCVAFRNNALNRSYVAEYTISGGEANTDVTKSVTLTLDTSGTWDTGSNVGLSVTWAMMCGSSFQQTAGSWQATSNFATSNQFNVMGTNGNVFELFDVDLFEGNATRPFVVPNYDSELDECQRYWEASFPPGTQPANNLALSEWAGFAIDTGNVLSQKIQYRKTKRVTPTITFYSSGGAHGSPTAGQWQIYTGTWNNTTGTQVQAGGSDNNTHAFMVLMAASVTAFSGYIIAGAWTANARL